MFRLLLIFLSVLAGGCHSTIDLKFPRDPGGGLLTSSEACLYDFDANGFWYVIFLRQDQLGICVHRHEAGHHLMMLRSGDILFYSRCSGRGESMDIMDKTFSLRQGEVFLVSAEKDATHVVQLPAKAKRFDGNDPAARAAALAALLSDPWVESFLTTDARLHVLADEQAQKQRKREPAGKP